MKYKDTIYKSIKDNGGMSALASDCGVGREWLYAAIAKGRLSACYCPIVERFTNGEVPCEWLNSSVDWGYVRSHPRGVDSVEAITG